MPQLLLSALRRDDQNDRVARWTDVERTDDHWIAFTLLLIVGGKMIWEGAKPRDAEDDAPPRRSGPWALIATAIGTSIDAAAVGVGLAFIGVNIWVIAASIGFTTFVRPVERAVKA